MNSDPVDAVAMLLTVMGFAFIWGSGVVAITGELSAGFAIGGLIMFVVGLLVSNGGQ